LVEVNRAVMREINQEHRRVTPTNRRQADGKRLLIDEHAVRDCESGRGPATNGL
jgi:hypothetical protein